MKHPFISKRYWLDKTTAMGKVDALAKSYDDVIDLSLGDPDQTTHKAIIDFAFKEAHKGHTKYTDFRGDPELRAAIATYYIETFDHEPKDEEIMISTSACLGMYLALEATLDDGDEVLIHTPCFTPYSQQIQLTRGVPVEVPTYETDAFQLKLENLEAAITDKTKVLIVNSPNNPTGAVFSKETLRGIVTLAIKYNLIIISDEIYGSYTFDSEFISLITFPEVRDRLIILNSFSKDYTMTGWRVGNIIAPSFIIKTCQMINENVVFTAPSISQRAALYAIKHRKEIQPNAVKLYKDRVFQAYEAIKKIPWMSVLKPKGTFYLFVNIKKTNLSSEVVSQIILEQAQVLTIPGNGFGQCGEGYIRLACTVSQEKFIEAVNRIEKIKF